VGGPGPRHGDGDDRRPGRQTREETWEATNDKGEALNRTLGLAGLGGATLDTEENYLLKKSFTAMGAVSIENQARI
jgi:formate dehydrogenase major subunit